MSNKIVIATDKAPAAIGPYVQATKLGNVIYASGQIPLNPVTQKIEEETIEGQAKQVLENIKAILESAGSSLDKVVKATCLLSDLGDFVAFNTVYTQYFNTATPPSRSTFQVAALPLGAKIEIEVIAEA